jgi:hypothetical protein
MADTLSKHCSICGHALAYNQGFLAGLERAKWLAEETQEDGEPKYNRGCHDVAEAIGRELEKRHG